MERLTLYIPRQGELGFYQSMLSDPDTMSYNAPWWPPDGCIPFPREQWEAWHSRWIGQEPTRFFAYLRRESDGQFVGYESFHFMPEENQWDMSILICASKRGKGYGRQALSLLLDRAFRVNGIPCLHNMFEPSRQAALQLHRQAGFREIGEETGLVHLLLTKEAYEQRLPSSTDAASGLTWIFFDLGSTLIDESEAELQRIREMLAGTAISLETYLQKRRKFAASSPAPDKAAMKFFGLKKAPWHSELEHPFPDALPVLQALRQAGFHLGVIANQQPGTVDRLRAWKLLSCFEVISASSELGFAKPDPQVFRWALQQANCSPREALMVGDRPDNDVAPANKLGMKTIRILRGVAASYRPKRAEEQADAVIQNLDALVGLLVPGKD